MTKRKAPPSALLTTAENTRQLQPGGVNSMVANERRYTPSAKTGNTPTSTNNLNVTLLNLTEREKENALLTADVFASTLPALLKYKLVRKARNMSTGEILIIFPSTVWTDDLKLKDA